MRDAEARLAMRGCTGVFMASKSRFEACGVLEPPPSSLIFLFASGELDPVSSILRLLGVFSLLGDAAVVCCGSALTLSGFDMLVSTADPSSHSVEISL